MGTSFKFPRQRPCQGTDSNCYSILWLIIILAFFSWSCKVDAAKYICLWRRYNYSIQHVTVAWIQGSRCCFRLKLFTKLFGSTHIRRIDLRGCYTVKYFVQLLSQCLGQVARNFTQCNIPCKGRNRCETSCTKSISLFYYRQRLLHLVNCFMKLVPPQCRQSIARQCVIALLYFDGGSNVYLSFSFSCITFIRLPIVQLRLTEVVILFLPLRPKVAKLLLLPIEPH